MGAPYRRSTCARCAATSTSRDPEARVRTVTIRAGRDTMVAMGDLVRVWASNDAIEAALIRGRLELEDVPVLSKGDAEGPYRTGAVYLFVPAEHETRARALIDAVRSGAFAITDEDVLEAADAADER
jgi:Putative prokaryotic signal transducing protein